MFHRFAFALRRRFVTGLGLGLCLGLAAQPAAAMNIGHNLGSPRFYTSNPAFKNLMYQSLAWCLKRSNGTYLWDQQDRTGVIPQRSYDGYPTGVPFSYNNQTYAVHTLVPLYFDGKYHIKVRGKGTIRYKAVGYNNNNYKSRTFNSNNLVSYDFTVDGVSKFWEFDNSGVSQRKSPSYLSLEITVSDATNPVRDIRIFWDPDKNANKHAFDQEFLNSLNGTYMVRFMDWGRTNNSNLVKWGDRTQKNWYSQTTKSGVAYEHMAELAKNRNLRYWVCVPHKANGNFINKMAELFRDQGPSGKKVFLEYSNEVWASIFQQTAWVNGLNNGGNNLPERYGLQAKNVFNRWSNIFGDDFEDRVVPVIAQDYSAVWKINAALGKAGNKVRKIAMAPYPGKIFDTVPTTLPSVDDLLENQTYSLWNATKGYVDNYKAAADGANKQLVNYEGGPHWLAGTSVAKDNNGLVDRLLDLNRYWKMRTFLRWDFFQALKNRGVETHLYFNIGGPPWNPNGAWSSIEYRGQTIGTESWHAQKEWALREFRNNQ